MKDKKIYEETEIQHNNDNGTMIQQEENVAMSVNTISNGISTIRIVPHHRGTIVVPYVGHTTILNT